MRQIIKEGVKTRVLMLSATPVNNRLADLKNQIAFATEGDDTALRRARHRQHRRHDPPGADAVQPLARAARMTSARPRDLMDMLGFDYFKLLDLLTIARSRKHIEKYYGTAETGRFPERLKPINIKADVDRAGEFRSDPRDQQRDPPAQPRRLRAAALRAAAQAGGLRREVQHRGSGRRGLLPAGRPRGKPDPPAARQRAQADGELGRRRSRSRSQRQLARRGGHACDASRRTPRPWRRSTSRTWTSTIRPSRACSSGARSRCCSQDVDLVRWRQDLIEDRNRLATLLSAARPGRRRRATPSSARCARSIAEQVPRSDQPRQPQGASSSPPSPTPPTTSTSNLRPGRKTSSASETALVTGTGQQPDHAAQARARTSAAILTAFSPRSKERPDGARRRGRARPADRHRLHLRRPEPAGLRLRSSTTTSTGTRCASSSASAASTASARPTSASSSSTSGPTSSWRSTSTSNSASAAAWCCSTSPPPARRT